MRRPVLGGLGLAVLLLLVLPESAAAWGPASHVHLGLQLLGSLDLFGAQVSMLLLRNPAAFLYGCIAADIPIGKSYTPEDRHPHSWSVGWDLVRDAGEEPALRACSLGYLCHLAADVSAHERFVPRRLLLTSSTRGVGHSYWEHRVDLAVGPEPARIARTVALRMEHRRLDDHLERTLDRALFSFGTSRRIFRGVVRLADSERWQEIFDSLVEQSRWRMGEPDARRYLAHAFELSAGFLADPGRSAAERGDPTGGEAMVRAKRIRRRVLLEEGLRGSDDALRRAADRFFPRPSGGGGLWELRGSTPGVADGARSRLLASSLPRAS